MENSIVSGCSGIPTLKLESNTYTLCGGVPTHSLSSRRKGSGGASCQKQNQKKSAVFDLQIRVNVLLIRTTKGTTCFVPETMGGFSVRTSSVGRSLPSTMRMVSPPRENLERRQSPFRASGGGRGATSTCPRALPRRINLRSVCFCVY